MSRNRCLPAVSCCNHRNLVLRRYYKVLYISRLSEIFQKHTKWRRGGGGVALNFSQAWSDTEANLPTPSPPSCDVLPVVDKVRCHCWLLVYRPPRVSAEDTRQLSRALSALLALHPQATIFEDLNYTKIAWLPHSKSLKPVADDNLSFEFFDEIWASWDLEQLVRYPSRKNSYLDIILTNNVNNFSSVDMFPPFLPATTS